MYMYLYVYRWALCQSFLLPGQAVLVQNQNSSTLHEIPGCVVFETNLWITWDKRPCNSCGQDGLADRIILCWAKEFRACSAHPGSWFQGC